MKDISKNILDKLFLSSVMILLIASMLIIFHGKHELMGYILLGLQMLLSISNILILHKFK